MSREKWSEILRAGVSKGRLWLIAVGFGISLAMAWLYLGQPDFFRFLDNKLFDTFVRLRHNSPKTDIPVIVDLDEQSLGEFGQWPWPRRRIAALLEQIQQHGARAVGLDMVFPEPDRSSPIVVQNELRRDVKVEVTFSGAAADDLDYDRILAKTLAAGPFALGFVFKEDKTRRDAPKPPQGMRLSFANVSRENVNATEFIPEAPTVTQNIEVLAKAAPISGFFSSEPDPDGVIRRTPMLMRMGDAVYPSLSLAALLTYMGKANSVSLAFDVHGLRQLQIERRSIPLDAKGAFRINFRGPKKTFPYISAADVLNNTLPAGALKDKIVFLGTSAAGLTDLRATPLDQVMPGVEVHATIIDNILSQDFLYEPASAREDAHAYILLTGFAGALLLVWTRALFSLIPLTVFSLALCAWSWRSFTEKGVFVSPLTPLLTLAAVYSGVTLFKYLREEREKKFFRAAFSKYVSKRVVDQLARSPKKLSLAGEEKVVSILFCDIRGFTSLSERLTPTQVSDLLHAYFTPMTRIILSTEGTLDKFIGDAVMAFWNAPLDTPCHERRAVEAALGMRQALNGLNETFKEKFHLRLEIGVGVHSGKVRVGNMGSEDLFDYTIIGDNVNLASRLEGLTKFYGLDILVSENLLSSCSGHFIFQEVDTVRVKGRSKPITIYTPYTREESPLLLQSLGVYEQAMGLYHARRFMEAGELFQRLLETGAMPLLAALYQERCRELAQDPPGADWDRVFVHRAK